MDCQFGMIVAANLSRLMTLDTPKLSLSACSVRYWSYVTQPIAKLLSVLATVANPCCIIDTSLRLTHDCYCHISPFLVAWIDFISDRATDHHDHRQSSFHVVRQVTD